MDIYNDNEGDDCDMFDNSYNHSGHKGISAEFTDKFQHGFPYLPVIQLKKVHPIWDLK